MNGLKDGVASITIENFSKPKQKNLDVLTEYEKSNTKNAANFVVIGETG